MKIFSTNLDDADLKELKDVLAQFYAKKSIDVANKAWNEKKLTNEDMDRQLDD